MLLAGAALCALAVRERPRLRYVFGGALLLAGLPWLGWTFVVPGVVVAWALVTWTLRERRRLAALVAGEALAASLVFYATINDRFYGGLTPRAAGLAGLPEFPLGYLERLPRLAGLWLDRDVGLLRWAPLLALVFFAGWLLYRSRRDQLARVAPARREAEACAGLLLGIAGAQLLVAALLTTGGLRGATFPGVPLVAALPAIAALTAWGLRHVPRPLAALLALFTLGASTWLVLAERSRQPRRAGSRSTRARPGARRSTCSRTSPASRYWPAILCALLAAGAAFLWWRERRAAGAWRRAAAASRTSRLCTERCIDAACSSPRTPPPTTRCARPSSVTVDALRAARRARPRSPLTTEQLAATARALDPCPPEGAPLARVLEDLRACSTAACGSATRGRSRTCTPRR